MMNNSVSFCNHWSISFSETPEHVKNYRPKILLMTGNPAHRPPLVNFGQLITKNTSLLLCGHVLDDPRPVNIDSLKNNVQLWLKDHKVKTFNEFHEWHSLFPTIFKTFFSCIANFFSRLVDFTVSFNIMILKLVPKL